MTQRSLFFKSFPKQQLNPAHHLSCSVWTLLVHVDAAEEVETHLKQPSCDFPLGALLRSDRFGMQSKHAFQTGIYTQSE